MVPATPAHTITVLRSTPLACDGDKERNTVDRCVDKLRRFGVVATHSIQVDLRGELVHVG